MNNWIPEQISTLETLWSQGQPTSFIGAQVGKTKNAVIGKAHRLGLATHVKGIKRSNRAQLMEKLNGQANSMP